MAQVRVCSISECTCEGVQPSLAGHTSSKGLVWLATHPWQGGVTPIDSINTSATGVKILGRPKMSLDHLTLS